MKFSKEAYLTCRFQIFAGQHKDTFVRPSIFSIFTPICEARGASYAHKQARDDWRIIFVALAAPFLLTKKCLGSLCCWRIIRVIFFFATLHLFNLLLPDDFALLKKAANMYSIPTIDDNPISIQTNDNHHSTISTPYVCHNVPPCFFIGYSN